MGRRRDIAREVSVILVEFYSGSEQNVPTLTFSGSYNSIMQVFIIKLDQKAVGSTLLFKTTETN